ncbi:MAG: MOSC domain-containing protein [Nanoarchaeota archaeon]|nr:MOSC domain-containing protein [Nanoarchaeota archaeon]
MTGKIISINISEKKGTPKDPVDEAELRVDHGIVGDAHAGPGIRQVSLMASEDIEEFKRTAASKVCIKHGIFGENLTTEGIDLEKLQIGDRLKVGEAIIEITKKGKECHIPCSIGRTVGKCIMPEKGVFGKVLKGGMISKGDQIRKIVS